MKGSLLFITMAAGVISLCSSAAAKPLKVYILAGQSNMEGHAAVRTFDHIGMDPATFRDATLAQPGEYTKIDTPQGMGWHVQMQRVVLFGSVAMILLFIGRTDKVARRFSILILLGILGNDVICGVLSAPDVRYQNRLLWLLPLLAALVAANRRWRPRDPA